MKLRLARNSFYDSSNKRIDVLDSRFYLKVGEENEEHKYYPSVTTVLEAFPKGFALTEWHKSLGFNADIVLQRAAEVGSRVHDAINRFLLGSIVQFGSTDESGNFKENYSLDEWKMIMKFFEFWKEYKPRLIATEVMLVSDTYKLGGTLDIVCEIEDAKTKQWEVWYIDAKSGNSVYDSAELQAAAYSMMWNEVNFDYTIQRAGILHLKADTRGPDKKQLKMQGKGWQVKEYDRHYGEAFKTFQKVRSIWDEQNPTYKPANASYPISISLEDLKIIEENKPAEGSVEEFIENMNEKEKILSFSDYKNSKQSPKNSK